MPALTKKRYTFGGTITANDADGLPTEHRAGDPVPDHWLAQRAPGEVDALRAIGMLREVGATPPPRPPEAPPTPPTPLEIIQQFSPRAARDGDRINPNDRTLAGVDFRLVARPREKDFEHALATGRTISVVVHEVGGRAVATVDLNKLCELLAGRGLVR